MVRNRNANPGPVGAFASLVASVALYRSALRAERVSPTAARVQPTSENPLALADRLSLEEPAGGVAKIRWQIDHYQRRHVWLAFPLAVVKKYSEDGGSKLAALIAYFGLFSVFPLMLAFTSIIGFVFPDVDAQNDFVEAAADQIPVVGGIVQNQTGTLQGSVIGIVVGIIVALWSGLRVVDAMQNALNKVWDVPPVEQSNMVRRRARSAMMLVVLGSGVVGSVVSSSLATFLSFLPGAGRIAIWAATAAVSVALMLVGFQVLCDRSLPWRDLVWGAVFSGLAWWLLQTFGTPFLARVAQDPTYGDFASIIALMTFLYLAAQLSILGAELNAVRARGLYPRSITNGDLLVSDIRAFELLATSTVCDDSYVVRLLPADTTVAPLDADDVAGTGEEQRR